MRTLRTVTVLLVVACLALDAEARLGETFQQCVSRYGPQVTGSTTNLIVFDSSVSGQHVVGSTTNATVFNKDGFKIEVQWFEGKAEWIRYTMLDGTDISATVRKTLHNANKETAGIAKNASVVYDKGIDGPNIMGPHKSDTNNKELIFWTITRNRRLAAESKAKEVAKTKGL